MNARVLTVFALASLPLLALVALVALGAGRAQLRTSFELHLSQVAGQTASSLDAYMYRQFVDVAMMGRTPIVRETAAHGSAAPYDRDALRALDKEWREGSAVPPAVASVLTNPAAAYFRDEVEHRPIYREVLLADKYGRLVAASNVTTDYDQSDEDWWFDARGLSAGRVNVTDVTWDESAGVFALEMSVPVFSPSGDELAGVLKVVADSREMLAFVANTRLGITGEATLVRPDGSIVFSRRPRDPDARFFASDLLRERLEAVDRGEPTFALAFMARDVQGSLYVVGVAPSQLGMTYPDLSWLVAVSQADDELFNPVRTQMVSLLVVIAAATIAVLIFALWFSMRLAVPQLEVDMHLVEHPPVSRIADEEEHLLGG
jgi:hypothetical protein